jgi:RHS repeat-associated protein
MRAVKATKNDNVPGCLLLDVLFISLLTVVSQICRKLSCNGNPAKKIKPGGSKTIYVGRIYEVDKNSGGIETGTKTYYPTAGAMRIGSTLYYVLKDHLGSASVVTDANGNMTQRNVGALTFDLAYDAENRLVLVTGNGVPPTSTPPPSATPSQTATQTATKTNTPSSTPTKTSTPSLTPTKTDTPAATSTFTLTPTTTNTPGGPTATPSPTFTLTPTITNTPSGATATPTATSSVYTYTSQPDGTNGVDTYIVNKNATTNYGTDVALGIGEHNNATNSIARTLIKFDLSSIPANAVITSASLSLWTGLDYSNNDRTIRVYRLLTPFDESQATWNESATGVSWQMAGASGSNDHESTEIGSVLILANETNGVEKQISLTPAKIQELVSGALTNNGFIIIADTELNDRFNYKSSDSTTASNRPKLVIQYTLPQGRAPVSSPVLAYTLPLNGGGQGGGHFTSYHFLPPQQSGSLTFTPSDDAYIYQTNGSTNYGADPTLPTDNSPVKHFLLKFNVSGVNGQPITNAKLRLYAVDNSDKGGDFYRVSDNTWVEGTVTWNNAPAADTTLLASLGSVSPNNWYEVDVSSLITGDGTYSFRISSTSSNGADYSSKEGANAPQVVIQTSSGPTATQTPTATVTPSHTLTATQTPTNAPPSGDKDTTGVFHPSNVTWYLKNTNATGPADIQINYGLTTDYPVMGDWDGNGTTTLGIYRNGSFYLRNSNTNGNADIVFAFGASGDQPIAGDWDGDGIDTIGVYQSSTGTFILGSSNNAGTAVQTFSFGMSGDVAIVGDWNGDGLDTTGVFRPSTGVFYLKNSNDQSPADLQFTFGAPGDQPVAGDWNNDGIDTIGVYRNGTFYLRNANSTGNADLAFALGVSGDLPIAGNWDGQPPPVSPTHTPGPTPTKTPTARLTPTNPPNPTPPPAAIFSNATFTYDGDGKRVKSAMTTNLGTTTTYFAGAHYEVTDGVITKHYYAGAQRIAMRSNGIVFFTLGDHLGSTSLTTFANGNVVSELRYKAWGEVRYGSGNTPTKYTYTGLYSYTSDFGLMFYNARWYDPYITQFSQPDSIIPDPYNPQSYDRYSYALNNPIRYTDPSGHRICEDRGDGCKPYTHADQINDLKLIIKDQFKWNVKGNDWTVKELETIYQTGSDILAYANEATGGNGLDWMHYAFGNTTIEHVGFTDGHSDTWPTLFGPRIRLNDNWLNDAWGAEVVFAHELGHVWDINSGFTASGEMNRDLGGSSWCFFCAPGDGVPQWKPSYHTTISGDAYGNTQRNEYFAEAFSATIYNPADAPAGVSQWVRSQMLIDVTRYLFPGGLQ